MSNLVVWRLLAPLLLRAVEKVSSDPLESMRLEVERENHPLVLYVEKALMGLYRPNGGLSCPELEKILKRDLAENPERVSTLVEKLVREYYAQRKPFRKYFRGEVAVYV
mgnify:CR=1 FL=1